MAHIHYPPTSSTVNQVIVLESAPGQARQAALQQWLTSREETATTWLLRCDRTQTGPWAGLREWLLELLPLVEAQAPDLLVKHDYELTRVLPDLRRRLPIRYPSLTDTSPQHEQIRNYPADRAFRILHGVIDFLTAWFERSHSTRWLVACDDYDQVGSLVRLFFAELMRRRGQHLKLTLLVAIAPNADDVAIGKFSAANLGPRIVLAGAADPEPIPDAEFLDRQIAELYAQLQDDETAQEIYLPKLIHDLQLRQKPDELLKCQIQAASIYARKGFYEDGLAFAQAALTTLEQQNPTDQAQRWTIEALLYTCYVALDKPLLAFDVMDAAMQRTTDPSERFRGCFMMAMLYIRELPQRDLAMAEAYLEQGLVELEQTDLSQDLKLFYTTFNRNGLALIRYRRGFHQEAVSLCEWCYEQIEQCLAPGEHSLYRSVLLFNIAQVHDFIGHHDAAIAYFTAAMDLDPYYSEYYNSRGNLFFKMGHFSRALDDYLDAIEFSAPYPEVWANIGQCYRQIGETEAAILAYTMALDLQPDQTSVLIARAQTYELCGEITAALQDYDQALALDQQQPLILANRATLRYEIGQLDAALADLNQAIALAADNPDLYQNRAIALMALGQTEKAVQDLHTYLRLNPAASDRASVESQLSQLTQEP